ncbi:hypothetical protein [Agromyces larvae]|uniref:Uncharacterized protein n=1 Tax=Agromyces larvae TaxID=2929802 RepID=A0ABY4C675_9MICO|nr:hypothetical protein [Agromyces larvae]UOE45493.1 hypothetical protein MTO99_06975 [Agromyces larvae]
MLKKHTATMLALAARLDSRIIVTEPMVDAWHEVVGDLHRDDARSAVIEHYRHETRQVMPADVRDRAALAEEARMADYERDRFERVLGVLGMTRDEWMSNAHDPGWVEAQRVRYEQLTTEDGS